MKSGLDLVQSYLVSGGGLTVTNPATGDVLASLPYEDETRVEARLDAAQKAQISWGQQTAKQRAALLMRWHALIVDHTEQLAELCTLECGKPLAESRGEVAYAASFIEWFAEEAKRAYGDVIPTHMTDRRLLVMKQPVGVVAAITPWNFPLAMITRKAAPALAAGCSIVVKPAETTPLSALALEALALKAGLPENLYQVTTTTNPAKTGSVLCSSPIVKKLSFTGSTPVGKILLKQCSDTVKRVSMELGGNAPLIVFEDADLDKAAAGAFVSKYRNAGQTCVCSNRILVAENVADAFVAKLKALVAGSTLGNGMAEGVTMGPLITKDAKEKVSQLVEGALGEGAQLAYVAEAPEGQFYPPTILTGVTHDMTISSQEIFGPVAPVMTFKTEEEAIQIANDTPYGLAAYFYSENQSRIWRVMEALHYGMVGVNEGILSTELAPFGGVKESGMGREGSRYGIDEYLELKYCCIGGLES